MKNRFFNIKLLSFVFIPMLITNCGQTSTSTRDSQLSNQVIETSSSNSVVSQPSPDDQKPSSTVRSQPTQISDQPPSNRKTAIATKIDKIKPGKYCFKAESKTLSGSAQVRIESNNQVTGSSQATIHNEPQGYYSSYTQTFTGTLNDQQLKLAIITQIENDTQTTKENWVLTNNALNTGRTIYKEVDCSEITQQSLERSSQLVRVKFAPGASEATLENSVVRGERDTYLLGAKAGQKMTVSITSLENNAVFDIIAPNQQLIEQETRSKSLILPTTGDYSIIVGGTRGNATYKLQVQIK